MAGGATPGQVKGMNQLIANGMAFYWGTSEWSARQLQEARGGGGRRPPPPPLHWYALLKYGVHASKFHKAWACTIYENVRA
jgi:hypothetical protein